VARVGAVVQGVIDELELSAVPKPTPPEDVWYAWQPLPLLDFFRGLSIVAKVAPDAKTFLDVGSGIGTKLALARLSGYVATGVEHHEPYASASRRLFPGEEVIVAEAEGFDGYSRYDVVYSYRICVNPDHQSRLNRVIADQLRPGALFFSAGGPYPDWLTHVGGQVWKA
jgi:SAM-dependent methyltransferase